MLSKIINTYEIIKPGIARLIISIVLIIILDLVSTLLKSIAIGSESRKESATTERLISRVSITSLL
jgi:hypothetical protein